MHGIDRSTRRTSRLASNEWLWFLRLGLSPSSFREGRAMQRKAAPKSADVTGVIWRVNVARYNLPVSSSSRLNCLNAPSRRARIETSSASSSSTIIINEKCVLRRRQKNSAEIKTTTDTLYCCTCILCSCFHYKIIE